MCVKFRRARRDGSDLGTGGGMRNVNLVHTYYTPTQTLTFADAIAGVPVRYESLARAVCAMHGRRSLATRDHACKGTKSERLFRHGRKHWHCIHTTRNARWFPSLRPACLEAPRAQREKGEQKENFQLHACGVHFPSPIPFRDSPAGAPPVGKS